MTYNQYRSYGHTRFASFILSRSLYELMGSAIIVGILIGLYL